MYTCHECGFVPASPGSYSSDDDQVSENGLAQSLEQFSRWFRSRNVDPNDEYQNYRQIDHAVGLFTSTT